ncbi:hypothetical protein COOONC_20571, partial [Cooperia oncophora]
MEKRNESKPMDRIYESPHMNIHAPRPDAKEKGNKRFQTMGEFMFNIDHGYLEALIRGFKTGLLSQSDYANLVQCETLE